jgi:hypothetical protein
MFARLLLAVLLVLIAWAVFAHASSGSRPERTYVVQPYDTLWTIAERNYDGDPRDAVWRIRERNGVGPTTVLQPGQQLRLP